EAVQALHPVPAVVRAGARGVRGAGEIDLLVQILADVADPQVVSRAVEAEAPRVAQPVGPDLAHGALAIDERVAGGNGVGSRSARPADVDPQELAEQCPEVLAVAQGITA